MNNTTILNTGFVSLNFKNSLQNIHNKHSIIRIQFKDNLNLFQESYQIEKTGIRVITLCPGLTETALTVDSPNKLLSRVMKADFVKTLDQLSIQT